MEIRTKQCSQDGRVGLLKGNLAPADAIGGSEWGKSSSLTIRLMAFVSQTQRDEGKNSSRQEPLREAGVRVVVRERPA
jgi:hypothetical protein